MKLEIEVNAQFVESAIGAMTQSAAAGETGDGKIFVLDLEECVRIRTEVRGSVAIG